MSGLEPGWQHFSHGADIGVRGVADTLEGAFEQTAVALTAVISDPAELLCTEAVTIECEAPDLELLLCDWLNALIYEMALRRVLFGRFNIEIEGTQLRAAAWGERLSKEKHYPVVEVKGATYTELKVYRHDDLWIAQCVVDV